MTFHESQNILKIEGWDKDFDQYGEVVVSLG